MRIWQCDAKWHGYTIAAPDEKTAQEILYKEIIDGYEGNLELAPEISEYVIFELDVSSPSIITQWSK